ncbi:MAG: CoA transferase [Dehalococcoidales bacterium]|jgi:crotonobetainyl-CoA:carnitine CoA-transferase CaiB-like acyl-CoA transferase
MAYPLEGIKVLDFSIAVAAPFGGTMLADMGAEVIKVERVQGEATRLGLPAGIDDMLDTSEAGKTPDKADWMAFNRGKKDLAVDIRSEQGREIVLKLAKEADVILQSFRPGVADRLGIGYEAIAKINPKIIYCSFSGYGETGPVAHRAGGDMWSQAMSGLVSVLGFRGGAPQMLPVPACDHLGGVLVAYAVMTALFVRERTGAGQSLTVNNLDAAMYLQFSGFAKYLTDGDMPYKLGRSYEAPPFGPFRAKDGDVLTIFGNGPMWPSFCKVVGVEQLADDPRYNTDAARRENREEIGRLLDEAFSRKTRAEWAQIFRDARMRCDPCLTYEEICAHPQVAANDMIYTTKHPTRGEIKMLGLPVKLQQTPGKPQGPSPLLGEHTAEILLRLGYGPNDIAGMEAQGIIKTVKKK